MDSDRAARRVRLLRLKAESTTFPAEAEALRLKADELERLYCAPDDDLAAANREAFAAAEATGGWSFTVFVRNGPHGGFVNLNVPVDVTFTGSVFSNGTA